MSVRRTAVRRRSSSAFDLCGSSACCRWATRTARARASRRAPSVLGVGDDAASMPKSRQGRLADAAAAHDARVRRRGGLVSLPSYKLSQATLTAVPYSPAARWMASRRSSPAPTRGAACAPRRRNRRSSWCAGLTSSRETLRRLEGEGAARRRVARGSASSSPSTPPSLVVHARSRREHFGALMRFWDDEVQTPDDIRQRGAAGGEALAHDHGRGARRTSDSDCRVARKREHAAADGGVPAHLRRRRREEAANGAADIADIAGIAEHATNHGRRRPASSAVAEPSKGSKESKSSELPTVMEFEGSADIGAPCVKRRQRQRPRRPLGLTASRRWHGTCWAVRWSARGRRHRPRLARQMLGFLTDWGPIADGRGFFGPLSSMASYLSHVGRLAGYRAGSPRSIG